MSPKREGDWCCALSIRVAVIDDDGVPQLTFNGHGIPSGVSLYHHDYVQNLNAYIKKVDGIIEEVGGVTASCINPYEDLKAALIGQKQRADAAEKSLADMQARLDEARALLFRAEAEICKAEHHWDSEHGLCRTESEIDGDEDWSPLVYEIRALLTPDGATTDSEEVK